MVAVLGETGYKAAVGEEELVAFDSHEPVEAALVAGGIVAEGGGRQFRPLAIHGADPLVAIKGLAAEMAGAAAKVFAKAVQPIRIAAVPWRFHARDQDPGFTLRVKKVA